MKKFTLLLTVLFVMSMVLSPWPAVSATEDTTVSVSEAALLNDGDSVKVEGYYVGVSDESPNTGNTEMLIKDISSNAILAVRNVPYGKFPNYGYNKGDKISFLATVRVSTNEYTPNKKYLDFSDENGAIDTTIISSGNTVTYDLSSATTVDSWDKMKELFTVNTLAPYSYFKFTGTTYLNYLTKRDTYRPHKNAAATQLTGIYTDSRLGGTHTLAMRNNVMKANLGTDWKSLFFDVEKEGYPGTPVEREFYAVYIGADSDRFYLVVLDESWVRQVQVEYTNADYIKEVAYAYRYQGGQIEYDQYNQRRHISPSPEDATAQHKIYLDCSSYVNACYLEAFGTDILPEFLQKNPYTVNFDSYAKDYPDNDDVIGYWAKEDYDTAEERRAITQWISEQLQIGDILTYRHGKKEGTAGHVYIYVGDSTFLHRGGAGSYTIVESDPSLSYDNDAAETTGKVATIAFSTIFTSTSNSRYIFKATTSDTVYSFSLLRPLARSLTPTQETLNRMTIAGLAMEKVSSVYENSSVRTGDTITYTVMLENTGSYHLKNIKLTDTLPAGTEFVSGSSGVSASGQNVTWTGTATAESTVTITYTVKVTATVPGTLIQSNATYVNGVKLGDITHTLSGISEADSLLLANKAAAYASEGKTFDSGLAMAYALYDETLGITLDQYNSVEDALTQLIDTENLTRHTSTALSRMLVPHLYGGMDIANGNLYIPDDTRTRLVSKEELAVGDIILAEWSGGNVVYVYAGGTTLLTLKNGVSTALTIGDNIYGSSADNILISLYGYDRFAVIRPSMVDWTQSAPSDSPVPTMQFYDFELYKNPAFYTDCTKLTYDATAGRISSDFYASSEYNTTYATVADWFYGSYPQNINWGVETNYSGEMSDYIFCGEEDQGMWLNDTKTAGTYSTLRIFVPAAGLYQLDLKAGTGSNNFSMYAIPASTFYATERTPLDIITGAMTSENQLLDNCVQEYGTVATVKEWNIEEPGDYILIFKATNDNDKGINFRNMTLTPVINESQNHTYSSDCDLSCNICGDIRAKGEKHTFNGGYVCQLCNASFGDVDITSWMIAPVIYVYDKGLMAGKGTDAYGRIKFDPSSPITREEFVQVLYNAESKPSVSIANRFPDVADNGWYKDAVLWANAMNIANGTGAGTFGVGQNISRQDLALMLMKYAALKGCSLDVEAGKINAFADGNNVSDYAKNAMDWAVTNGVLSGKGAAGAPPAELRLDPTGTATRAECAAMLKNFMTAFGL